jgi:hypothetical protein
MADSIINYYNKNSVNWKFEYFEVDDFSHLDKSKATQ